ncbi:MAG: hypothetical protein K2X81_00825 [Candidatus Obscuribacterales bacterium]|nr:hypothetical protein [Candidatus Obscuribacterales bacterium]
MQEEYEFRIPYEYAHLLFEPDEGELLGGDDMYAPSIQKITISPEDPRFKKIGMVFEEMRAKNNKSFYLGWNIRRKYTQDELSSAEVFSLKITARFEPAGEECGTKYDKSSGCRVCRGWEKQTTDLILNCKKIPKSREICSTIADEYLVSERLANVLKTERITGLELHQVRDSVTNGNCKWYQLVLKPTANLTTETIFGDKPFSADPETMIRCSIGGPGHVLGLNLLSEVFVKRSTWTGEDISCTYELRGWNQGLLRTRPIILITPRLRSLLLREKVKKFETNVAYLR